MLIKQRHAIFASLIIILMLLSIFSVLYLRDFKTNDFKALGHQVTHQSAAVFELWLSEQVQMAQSIAANTAIVDFCLEPANASKATLAQEHLTSLQHIYPYYENLPLAIRTDMPIDVSVGDQIVEVNNGEFIMDTAGQTTIGMAGTSYTYISEIFEGKPYYISNIYHSMTRGNPILVVSAPIYYNEEIIGVAIVSPKMNYITQHFVDAIHFGDTGYMFMVDSANQTIAHRDRKLILNEDTKTHAIVEKITDNIDHKQHFFQAKLYKSKKYYYGIKLDIPKANIENDIYLVLTQNKTELFNRVYTYAFFSIVIVLIITVLLHKFLMLINKIHLFHLKESQFAETQAALESQVKQRTACLEDMAKRDSMTGLYNHKYAHEHLLSRLNTLEANQHLALAILDIDNFKTINDTYGHQVGDTVIKTLASLIQSNLRTSDIVGRYGGEEFIVILDRVTPEESRVIMACILQEIANHHFANIDSPVTVSIGLANASNDSSESIIRRADMLMYQAKDQGKNRLIHDQDLCL